MDNNSGYQIIFYTTAFYKVTGVAVTSPSLIYSIAFVGVLPQSFESS